MKTNKWIVLTCIVAMFSLLSCRDVFEKDISNMKVEVNSPVNNGKSVIYKQLFWWNPVDGATKYHIQIVSPSFDSLVYFIADTIVEGDKFYKTLSPGKYEWRIKAENGAYETKYQTYKLTMLLAPLNLQTVNLVSPLDNDYNNKTQGGLIEFTWEPIAGVTKYIIEIDTINGNFVLPKKIDSITTASYNYTLASSADIKWRVKGKNAAGDETSYSEVWYTGYLATAPNAPKTSAPSDGATYDNTNSVNYAWLATANATSYILHTYKLASDTAGAGTTTVVATTSKTLPLISETSGTTIYWRVSAIDKAGNESGLSYPVKSIKIN